MKTLILFLSLLLCGEAFSQAPIVRNNYTTNSNSAPFLGYSAVYSIPSNSPNTSALAYVTNVTTDLTYNEGGLGWLSQRLWTNGEPSLLFFGDSTGPDIETGCRTWLSNYTSTGVLTSTPFSPGGFFYLTWTPVSTPFYTDPYYFWGPNESVALNAGTNGQTTGLAASNTYYFFGNVCQVWWYASASNGYAVVQWSTNNSTWTNLGVINASTGPEGTIQVTNYNLTNSLTYYTARIYWTNNGTTNTNAFRMPGSGFGVWNTNANQGAFLYDMSGSGEQLSDWLNMGPTNISNIFYWTKPTDIIYEQTKPVSGYTNYVGYFNLTRNTNLVEADNILIPAQIGTASNDPPLSAVQALVMRAYAISNNASLIDLYTPLSVRSNIVQMGDNADAIVHLNAQGKQWAFTAFEQKIHLFDIWAAAGQLNQQNYNGTFSWSPPGGQPNMTFGNFQSSSSGYSELLFGANETFYSGIQFKSTGQLQILGNLGGSMYIGLYDSAYSAFGYNVRFGQRIWTDGGQYFGDFFNGGLRNNDPGAGNFVIDGPLTNNGVDTTTTGFASQQTAYGGALYNSGTTGITNKVTYAIQVDITAASSTLTYHNYGGTADGTNTSLSATLTPIIPVNGYIGISGGSVTINGAWPAQ